MCNILCIETATSVCSVAVSRGNEVIFEKENTTGPSHASFLGVFVAEALKKVNDMNIALDAIAVSCGPGSYTGLRIGVSEAKGLCYGMDIPMIAVKTPQIIAKKLLDTTAVSDDTLLCPMIDARRMEVYAAIYDKSLNLIRDIAADIVEPETYSEYLSKHKVLFFGDGSQKCKALINNDNAIFIDNIYPSATSMVSLAREAFMHKEFVDVAYFEPFYLKDFVATTPKNKVL